MLVAGGLVMGLLVIRGGLWVGALGLGITAWGAAAAARELTEQKQNQNQHQHQNHVELAAGALVLVTGPLAFHAASEPWTSLACALLVWSLALTLRVRRDPAHWHWLLLVIALALLPLVRTDLVVFSAIFAFAGLRRELLRYLPVLAAGLIAWLIHSPTLSIGQMVPLAVRRFPLVFAAPMLPTILPWLALGAISAAIVADLRERRLYRAILPIAIAFGYFAFSAAVARPGTFVPLYPLVMILLVAGVESLAGWIRPGQPVGVFVEAALVLGIGWHGHAWLGGP
jgi:hypothetical protein